MAEREDHSPISLKLQCFLYALCYLYSFQYKVINQLVLPIERDKLNLITFILTVTLIVFLFYTSLLSSQKL